MNNPFPFRTHHILQILLEWKKSLSPPDKLLYSYFRAHKALGSKDRKAIAQTVFNWVKWEALIEHCNPTAPLEKKIEWMESEEFLKAQQDKSIPLSTRFTISPYLITLLEKQYGKEEVEEICRICNGQAPTYIRVNPLKIDRSSLKAILEKQFPLEECVSSPYGLKLFKRENLFSSKEFQQGLFEMQDEGSQLIALLCKVKPGDLALDYCAGSGGKSLAFAPFMKNQGQIYLHDIRDYALQEAKKRLKRAGIQNAQLLLSNSPHKEKLKRKMDWVFVDAPCSGSGTFRRNPDGKTKFTEEDLTSLIGKQRTIFEKALSYVKKGGKIIYATCSILQEENEEQVHHFLSTYPVSLVEPPFFTLPKDGEMDGFFAACFQRQEEDIH